MRKLRKTMSGKSKRMQIITTVILKLFISYSAFLNGVKYCQSVLNIKFIDYINNSKTVCAS